MSDRDSSSTIHAAVNVKALLLGEWVNEARETVSIERSGREFFVCGVWKS